MALILRIPDTLFDTMLDDLRRPQSVAYERVGFSYGSTFKDAKDVLVDLRSYKVLDDEQYISDPTVGARIGSEAIRNAMQGCLDRDEGCFHVHFHPWSGVPHPSSEDLKGILPMVVSFRQLAPQHAHGMIILSPDKAMALISAGNTLDPITADRILVTGRKTRIIGGGDGGREARASIVPGAKRPKPH